MKFSILTLGCKVNQSESDVIEGNLNKHGWSVVGLYEHPDYCIINTCTVTAKSDYQSRQLIRRAVKAGAKVIVTGCYAQLKPEEVNKIEGVSCIIENSNKFNIINMLSNNTESITFSYGNRSRPFIKVQDGCNYSCSYCVVPLARGKSRSLSVSEVVKRVKNAEATGYHEVVITGINLGSYGSDLEPKVCLSEMIKIILKETKKTRIRLSSIEVAEVDNDLIELLQEKRISKHIHLPLQSGDNTILRLMNRIYTSEAYGSTVEKIYKKVPDISIGTDVIIGFPGEGEKEFKNTKELIDALPITYMHIFPYSPRQYTIASKMPDLSTYAVKKERYSELNALNNKKKGAYMSSQVNKVLDVIIEARDRNGLSIGTASNYLKIKVPSNGYPVRTLVNVRVTRVEGNLLIGDLLEKR